MSEMTTQQEALFDYNVLDAETRIVVQQRAGEIKSLAKRVAGDIVDIGAKLAEVKDRLGGNGRFNAWLGAELGWSERTAYNFIAVHQRFGTANFAIENVAPSALYLLVAPGTPEPARQAAMQMANAGEQVTHKLAKELVDVAKAAEPKTADLFGAEPEEDDAEAVAAELVREDGSREPQPENADKPLAEPAPSVPEKSGTPPVTPAVETGVERARKWLSEATIQVNVRMMPTDGDPRGRQAIVAISANDGTPVIASKRLPDKGPLWPGPIGEAIGAFIEKEAANAQAATTKSKAKAKTKAKTKTATK